MKARLISNVPTTFTFGNNSGKQRSECVSEVRLDQSLDNPSRQSGFSNVSASHRSAQFVFWPLLAMEDQESTMSLYFELARPFFGRD